MITPKGETLALVLSDFGLKELPKEWNKATTIMVDGIALCTKAGGIKEYCRVVYDGENIVVKKDYGRSSIITSFDKIYAVHTLDKKYTPDLRSDKQILGFLVKNGYNESNIIALLAKDGKTPEKIKEDRSKIKELINKEAIKWAKRSLEEEYRCKNIQSFANRIKIQKDEENKSDNH